MNGLCFLDGHGSHAREHGFSLVGIEACAWGYKLSVNPQAGALGVAGFSSVFVATDVDGLSLKCRTG